MHSILCIVSCVLYAGCNRLHWFAGCPLILYHKQIQQWRTAPSEAFTAGYPWNAADKNQMPKYQRYDDRDDDARPKVEISDLILSELVPRQILCGLRIANITFEVDSDSDWNAKTPGNTFLHPSPPFPISSLPDHLYWFFFCSSENEKIVCGGARSLRSPWIYQPRRDWVVVWQISLLYFFIFVTLIFVMKYNWQIQIQIQQYRPRLSAREDWILDSGGDQSEILQWSQFLIQDRRKNTHMNSGW